MCARAFWHTACIHVVGIPKFPSSSPCKRQQQQQANSIAERSTNRSLPSPRLIVINPFSASKNPSPLLPYSSPPPRLISYVALSRGTTICPPFNLHRVYITHSFPPPPLLRFYRGSFSLERTTRM